MEVKGMWITVNIENLTASPSVPSSVPRSVSIHDLFSASFSPPFLASFSAPFYAPFHAPSLAQFPFILFIVYKRRLSSLFWSLVTIIEHVVRHWSHTDAQGLARLSANSSQQYTSLNYYTKRLVFSRRSRTRKQSNWKTENETGEGLFPSPSRFWEHWQTDKRTEFAQPTSDFCFQRLENLVLALQANAGHLGFQRCSTIIPALWGHNLVKFNP